MSLKRKIIDLFEVDVLKTKKLKSNDLDLPTNLEKPILLEKYSKDQKYNEKDQTNEIKSMSSQVLETIPVNPVNKAKSIVFNDNWVQSLSIDERLFVLKYLEENSFVKNDHRIMTRHLSENKGKHWFTQFPFKGIRLSPAHGYFNLIHADTYGGYDTKHFWLKHCDEKHCYIHSSLFTRLVKGEPISFECLTEWDLEDIHKRLIKNSFLDTRTSCRIWIGPKLKSGKA